MLRGRFKTCFGCESKDFCLLARSKIAGILGDMARFCDALQRTKKSLTAQIEILKCPRTIFL